MLEKCARAIKEKVPYGCQLTDDEARDCARAVIETMRVPTGKMLSAACAAMSPGKRPTPNRVGSKAKHGIRYRAMIDVALGANWSERVRPLQSILQPKEEGEGEGR